MTRAAVPVVATALALTVAPAAAPARGTRPSGPHSSGCGSVITAGRTNETLPIAGTTRRYRLAVPAHDGRRALSLILNFHGYTSTADAQGFYSQLEVKGPPRGFIVVTPQGTGKPAYWNIIPKQLAVPDDVAYAGALIDHVEHTLCIDPTRVYATGISNGAGLSALLGCRVPNRLAAIAPVAGINLVAGCPHGTPTSVIAFHGSTDPVLAYGGGHTSPSLAGLPLTPVPASLADWAKRARCASKPTTTTVTPHVQRTNYRQCTSGTNVELYTIIGGGHTWPGAIDVSFLGPTTHEINTTDLMLTFFSHHTRPGAR